MRGTWIGAVAVAAGLVGVVPARAAMLEEVQELRRRLDYEHATLRLQMVLPDLAGEDRAQALLLLAQLDTDAREARAHLADAARLATQPATRLRAAVELASLDYAHGNYRAVQTRLAEFATEPQAALWLGLAAAGVGETATLPDALEPAARSDLARALLGWAALERGDAAAALAQLEPLSEERRSEVLPAVLLWKARAEAELGQADGALATVAELRERFPDAPESRLAQPTIDALHGSRSEPESAPERSERWALQLGAFEDRANALRFRAAIPSDLEPVSIEAVAGDRGPLYRVLAGSFESRDAAEAWAQAQLAPRGQTWQVVRTSEVRGR